MSEGDDGYYFEGVADLPIPDEQDDHTFGYTRSRWIKGDGVIGALIDFEHGDHDLGRVTRTFVRNHKGQEWLALGARLKSNTKPELVQMIREWAKLSIADPEAARKQLKRLGLSLRYITSVDPVRKIKTGTRLREVSFHRNAHHKDADILVCQGEHDQGEIHTSVPLADLVSGGTKRLAKTNQHRQQLFSFPPLSAQTMASAPAATPMEGVSNTAAAPAVTATSTPAPAPTTTTTTASSTSGLSIEMVKLMAELEREKQARMEAEQANKRYEEEKKAQEAERKAKEAAVRAQQAEQKKNDFMALKEHFADIGIDMENADVKRQYEAIFSDENAAVFYNSQLTALKKLADSKKLLQEKEAKLVEYDKGLQELVNAKRLRPNEIPQQQQAKPAPGINQQNLPRTAEQAQELAKNDPAVAELRARVMSRESGGIAPVSFGLVNGKPSFQFPPLSRQNPKSTGAPAAGMSAGGASSAVLPLSSVVNGSVAIPVAQGAGATPVHTGDPITNALVGNPDEKIKRTAFAFQDSDKGVLYGANGRTIDLSKFNLPGHSIAALGNSMLNMDCGWSYPTKNFDRDADSMKRKTIIM